MIKTSGPLPVSTYMQLCLHDPAEGYYATRPGLGQDFITAPEISQVFGELLGLWTAHEWQALNSPKAFHLIELGPGRGTLMVDAMRAMKKHPANEHVSLGLVEASPALRKVQSERLSANSPHHFESLAEIPHGNTIILANEYLDCLPARQFVNTDNAWQERVVGLDKANDLAFGVTSDRAPKLPATEHGSLDIQSGLETLIDELNHRHENGEVFRALFIDYGTSDGPPQDSLRAFQNGAQIHPLAAPGQSDLTVDVDFLRLRSLAEKSGLSVFGPITQSTFLMRLGIEARMQSLISAQPDKSEDIYNGVRRLVDPAEMGERFKVICISSPGLPVPAGF